MEGSPSPGSVRLRKVAYWLIIIAGILVFLIYFQKFLKPFVLALVFWYFIKELRELFGRIRIRKKRMPRWLRGFIAIVIMLVLIGSIGELLTSNISQIVKRLPRNSEIQQGYIDKLGESLGMEDLASKLKEQLKDIEVTGFLRNILNSLTTTVGDVVLIIIYIVFLLIEEIIFIKKIRIISASNKQLHNIQSLLDQINQSINMYVMMKTLVSLSTGIMSYFILLILGVDFPVFWAFLIFILNYIPYIGSLIATLLPAVFAMFQFDNGWYFFYVFLPIQAVQTFNANYLEPKVMGRSLNLSPLVVVLSLTIWSSIWGILGMLLSVPIMSVLNIMLAQFPQSRNISIFLSETGNIESLLAKFAKKDEKS
ncbi:MAG: AI-2E family transporter [Cyclobacteriaceae bacterium]|nr:AI-2E family transporter [Cyclobacteriaceae bacterium]